ncbi:MAG: type II toxin-antitoxin system RelE/ParE family toxin [Rhodanobacteraceae bacterium]|nr:MAG: type II toxin-antitoxin system RelE/ParE family toxin [Rhodanobacteraceae bacterium]
MRLVYAAGAVDDLSRLHAFIAQHDPAAAQRIADDLASRIEALRDAPLMGSTVAGAPDPQGIRDMVFGNHIVRYVVTARSIAVLRVWHYFESRD